MKKLKALIFLVVAGWSGGIMAASVSTHLMFQGSMDEAINLYKSVFPDFVVLSQELHESGELQGRVRLAYVSFAGHDLVFFDSPPVHDFTFTPSMSLFVEFDDADQLTQAFETLSEQGDIAMPLDEYEFSPLFGFLQDKYGVAWQLSLKAED